MRRSPGLILALPLIAALATPAAGVSAESRRPPTGPAVVTTDNENPVLYDQLRFWVIDPAGADAGTPLTEVTAPEQAFLFNPDREAVDEEHTAYGLAVYQPRPGTAYAVVTQEGRTAIATAAIEAQGTAFGYTAVGRIDMPGAFPLPDGTTWVPCEEPGVLPQLEGLSVDRRNGALYAAQEDVGVWRVQLPLGSSRPVLIYRVADFGIHDVFDEESEECVPVDADDTGFGGPNLVADAEGVDIYYGPGATGYVIVSSQSPWSTGAAWRGRSSCRSAPRAATTPGSADPLLTSSASRHRGP